MKHVEPIVTLLATPQLEDPALVNALSRMGAADWETDAPSDAEKLIEVAGRVCYRSFAPGLNPNVQKVREGNEAYLGNILAQHHGSVLEHVQVSFLLEHVSRVFTHEIVRHRVGCAISQESMRYVRLTDIPFWVPPSVRKEPLYYKAMADILGRVEYWTERLSEHWKLDDPTTGFAEKKAKTSALRRFAPQGVATGMVWSANFRTLRHVLALRTDLGAEEEIRLVFDKIGYILHGWWPHVFGDFIRTVDGVWKPKHEKV